MVMDEVEGVEPIIRIEDIAHIRFVTPGLLGAAVEPRRILQQVSTVRCEIDRLGAIEARMVAEA